MNRPELYNKTVDILYQAYFNDTLRHGNCYACAVGNIIAANMKLAIRIDEADPRFSAKLFWEGYTSYNAMRDSVICRKPQWYDLIKRWGGVDHKEAMDEVFATGYTVNELFFIEKAFEAENKSFDDNPGEQAMFNGLVAVLNTLREIHEVTDEPLLQANNKRFADHYKVKTNCV